MNILVLNGSPRPNGSMVAMIQVFKARYFSRKAIFVTIIPFTMILIDLLYADLKKVENSKECLMVINFYIKFV